MKITHLIENVDFDKAKAITLAKQIIQANRHASPAELKILAKNADAASMYAADIKQPVPELEPILLTSAQRASDYAINSRKSQGRWPEYEQMILGKTYTPTHNELDDMYAAQGAATYALYILKGPWPEAEPTIALNPFAAYFYAANVLKHPWPPGEPVISHFPLYTVKYAIETRRPWPEKEEDIVRTCPSHVLDEYEDMLGEESGPKALVRFTKIRRKYNK